MGAGSAGGLLRGTAHARAAPPGAPPGGRAAAAAVPRVPAPGPPRAAAAAAAAACRGPQVRREAQRHEEGPHRQ